MFIDASFPSAFRISFCDSPLGLQASSRQDMDSSQHAPIDKAETTGTEKSRTKTSRDDVQRVDGQSQTLGSQTAKVDMAEGGPPSGKGRPVTTQKSFASSSITQPDTGPGFAHIDGDIGGAGYNDTEVDVITVPCPGADPVQTWTSDPLPDDYFRFPSRSESCRLPAVAQLAGDAILSPAIDHPLPRAGHIWVRRGIRRNASTARVLLYRHCALVEGLNLERLARDLLDRVQQQRQGTVRERAILPRRNR